VILILIDTAIKIMAEPVSIVAKYNKLKTTSLQLSIFGNTVGSNVTFVKKQVPKWEGNYYSGAIKIIYELHKSNGNIQTCICTNTHNMLKLCGKSTGVYKHHGYTITLCRLDIHYSPCSGMMEWINQGQQLAENKFAEIKETVVKRNIENVVFDTSVCDCTCPDFVFLVSKDDQYHIYEIEDDIEDILEFVSTEKLVVEI
jgi:hypothetical protein